MTMPVKWREADRYVASELPMARGASPVVSACSRCGSPIARRRTGGRWVHLDGDFSLGCRAATFNGHGWDERVPGTWSAVPTARYASTAG